MRYVKRKYGVAGKALKVPISIGTLHKMSLQIPGWPTPTRMKHNDMVFVAASIIATIGFLRGGEFLFTESPGRPLLRHCDVSIAGGNDDPSTVSVCVAQLKARWWLQSVTVPCFDPGISCPVRPCFWLNAYRRLSLVALSASGPAFVLIDGSPLSKSWMLARTNALLLRAGIKLADETGRPVHAKASSWRAGGSIGEAGRPE